MRRYRRVLAAVVLGALLSAAPAEADMLLLGVGVPPGGSGSSYQLLDGLSSIASGSGGLFYGTIAPNGAAANGTTAALDWNCVVSGSVASSGTAKYNSSGLATDSGWSACAGTLSIAKAYAAIGDSSCPVVQATLANQPGITQSALGSAAAIATDGSAKVLSVTGCDIDVSPAFNTDANAVTMVALCKETTQHNYSGCAGFSSASLLTLGFGGANTHLWAQWSAASQEPTGSYTLNTFTLEVYTVPVYNVSGTATLYWPASSAGAASTSSAAANGTAVIGSTEEGGGTLCACQIVFTGLFQGQLSSADYATLYARAKAATANF